jgi:ubiquitin carboxyl-terminal hydrolase 8
MATERDSRGLSGIINLGNTCYMNATLQCLFATDLFNYYIKSKKFKKDLLIGLLNLEFYKQKDILKINPHITETELKKDIFTRKKYMKLLYKNSLTYCIYQVFTMMWSVNCDIKPKKLKDAIAYYCPKFAGYAQHDSEELLYALFDRLNDETKTNIKINKFTVSDEVSTYYKKRKEMIRLINECDEDIEDKEKLIQSLNKLISDNYNNEIIIKSKEFWKSYMKDNHSVISQIFTGLFCSKVRCNNCNNCNITFEPFNILEVQLTDKNGNFLQYLDECLQNFSTGETVTYKCDACKIDGTATKEITIFDAPPRLIIQLKRFNSPGNMRIMGSKINNLIKFPLENLNVTNISTDIKQIKDTYNLYATVNHSGNLGGGHYVSNCKNILDGKWYHFNDDSINYIDDANEIIDASAYILFYEKQ